MKLSYLLVALLFTITCAGTVGAASVSEATKPAMKITTFETTSAGESKFRDIEIPLALQRDDGFGHTLSLSTPYASPNVQFVELPAGLDQDWHNAPARQIVVVLSGVIEVETTDGARRQWRAGEAFLPADVTGRGHRTRCIDGAVRLLFAPLPEEFGFGD
jgi:quercetin dioxygenase-like cupin family protein